MEDESTVRDPEMNRLGQRIDQERDPVLLRPTEPLKKLFSEESDL